MDLKKGALFRPIIFWRAMGRSFLHMHRFFAIIVSNLQSPANATNDNEDQCRHWSL